MMAELSTLDWNSRASDCARDRRANFGADSIENLAPPRSAAVAPADEQRAIVMRQAFTFLGDISQCEASQNQHQNRTTIGSDLG